MEIAIIGYGRMGKEIERLAVQRGHSVRSIIDPVAARSAEQANRRSSQHVRLRFTALLFKEITSESLEGVDVAIEFTSPEAAAPSSGALEYSFRAAGLKSPCGTAAKNWDYGS
jgi:4-hydroxy-tetrahydrodipicolinate reductase